MQSPNDFKTHFNLKAPTLLLTFRRCSNLEFKRKVSNRWKLISDKKLSHFSKNWETSMGGRRFGPFFLLLHKDLKRMLSGVVPRLRGD